MKIRRLFAVTFGVALFQGSFPAVAQKVQTPAGQAPRPWILGTIGVGRGEDPKTPKTTALKGMAIQIGDHGEAAMAYDLDLCRVVGAWTGKFTIPMNLPSRGAYLAAMGDVAFTTGEVPGFLVGPPPRRPGGKGARPAKTPGGKQARPAAPGDSTAAEEAKAGGSGPATIWKDPRPEPFGPLPPGQARFKGFYVHGDKIILKWDIGGTEVLELPAYDVVLNGGGYFTRTLRVASSKQALQILVAGNPQVDGPINFPTHRKTEGEVAGLEDKERIMQSTPWVHGDHGEVMIWAAGDPDGSMWRMINGELALEVAPHAKAVTFQIAYWTVPATDPDGRGAPLFFREPEIDLLAIVRNAVFHAPN